MARLLPIFIVIAAIACRAHGQNILDAFSSLFGARIKPAGGKDIFHQFFDNPNPLNGLFGGKGGDVNFDSILKTFTPHEGGDGGALPDLATLFKNGLTDVISIAGGNQTRANGTGTASHFRPTLSSAESESQGIPIEGGFEPRHRSDNWKPNIFGSDSAPDAGLIDPAFSLLNDTQIIPATTDESPVFSSFNDTQTVPTTTSRSTVDDPALEQILRAIEAANFN